MIESKLIMYFACTERHTQMTEICNEIACHFQTTTGRPYNRSALKKKKKETIWDVGAQLSLFFRMCCLQRDRNLLYAPFGFSPYVVVFFVFLLREGAFVLELACENPNKQTNILEFVFFFYFKARPAMSPGGLGRKTRLENIQTLVKVNCT